MLNKVIKYFLIFFVSLFFSFTSLSVWKYYQESSFNKEYKPSFIYKVINNLYLSSNNCSYINNYVNNVIEFSEINKVSTNEIKVIMNKCPELFKEDLVFLNNSVKNKKINYEENEFLFYSMKYFYIIDKNYILNTIKSNQYESEEANLLKEKVLSEK